VLRHIPANVTTHVSFPLLRENPLQLEDKMLKILCSEAKNTTVVAAKDCHNLGKACVYTAEDVVQLREERERLDIEKVAKAKIHQEKAAAKVVSSGEGFKSSKHAEKKIIGAKKVPVNVLSYWENEEEDMVGGERWDEEENRGEEDSVVYIGDMLDLEDAMEHGKGREGVSSQPPVVTRSGRVVKMGHLGQQIPPAGGRFPSHGRSPGKIRYSRVSGVRVLCHI